MPGVDIKKDDMVQVMRARTAASKAASSACCREKAASWSTAWRSRRSTCAASGKRSTGGQQLQQGGIIDAEMFIDISNVQVVCKSCGKATRIGHRDRGRREGRASAADARRSSEDAWPNDDSATAEGERFREELVPRLMDELGLHERHAGAAAREDRREHGRGRRRQGRPVCWMRRVADLDVITGQKPVVTKARKSIAGFKLREGMSIGAKVTLRGDRMWEFLDRLRRRWRSRGSATSGGWTRTRSTGTGTTRSA